jgi:hypothetical protein
MINKNSTLLVMLSALSIVSSSFSMETETKANTNSEAYTFVYKYVKPEWIKKCSFYGVYPFFRVDVRNKEFHQHALNVTQTTSEAQEKLKDLSDQDKISTHQLNIISAENEKMRKAWKSRYNNARGVLVESFLTTLGASAVAVGGTVYAINNAINNDNLGKYYLSVGVVGLSVSILSGAIPSFYYSRKTLDSSLKLWKHHQDINETVSGILLNRKQ